MSALDDIQWQVQQVAYDKDTHSFTVGLVQNVSIDEMFHVCQSLPRAVKDPLDLAKCAITNKLFTLVVTELSGSGLPTIYTVGLCAKGLETHQEIVSFFKDHPIIGDKQVMR